MGEQDAHIKIPNLKIHLHPGLKCSVSWQGDADIDSSRVGR